MEIGCVEACDSIKNSGIRFRSDLVSKELVHQFVKLLSSKADDSCFSMIT
jgi:hypothetical protein